jgi:DNA processing protein
MNMSIDSDYELLCAALLAELPNMTTARLLRLLSRWSASDAIEAIQTRRDELDVVLEGCTRHHNAHEPWQRHIKRRSLAQLRNELRDANVHVWVRPNAERDVRDSPLDVVSDVLRNESSSDVLAEMFADDEEAPPVLFYRGSLSALNNSRAAIVGTRDASPHGKAFATKLAKELAQRDVSVVSGLALGIDSAAHAGVIGVSGGAPIGVVGTGLDVVYPPANHRLWREVSEKGLLISERPLGAKPTSGAFPARNRIIAQLSQVVVVVESRDSGGSLITAQCAFDRNRTVLAVPGSPLQEQCAGSNALLRGGRTGRLALPCLAVSDVLVCLDVETVSALTFFDDRIPPSPHGEELLRVMGWDPWATGRLIAATGIAPSQLSAILAELEQKRWLARSEGRWHRRSAG